MKKTITIIALAALFVSCAKEAEQTPAASGNVVTVAPTELYATLENPEPDTKTTLGGDNGTTVLWEEGDSISVWPGVFDQAKYTLSSGAGTNSATFTSDQTVTGDEIPANVALYPYDENVTLDHETGDFINVTFPKVQNYKKNSWDKGAMPMAAMSVDPDDHNFQFMNFAGVLRLTLTGTATIDSIRVSALGKEYDITKAPIIDVSALGYKKISGTARVTIAYPEHEGDENTVLVAFDSESSSNTVTLKCGESGVALSEATRTVFNIVIPPITGGFKVTIYDNAHGFMVLQSSSRIKRSTILNMPTISYAPDAMDLGLSVYWATCNVGATTPDGYGDYFAWGETEPYYKDGHASDDPCTNWKNGKSNGYAWGSYSFTEDSGSTFTKYNGTDGKTVLEAEHDAASVNLGSDWRMPTDDEMTELTNTANCKWTWATINGVNGYKVTSKVKGYTDAAIFLPAAGYRTEGSLNNVGSYGYYWSSSLYWGNASGARFLYFGDSSTLMYDYFRFQGLPVRPVAEK